MTRPPAPAERLQAASAPLLAVVWVAELVLIARPSEALATVGAVAMALFLLLALTRGSLHIRAFFVLVVVLAAALAWANGVTEALARGYGRAQVFGAFLPSVLLLRATVEASPLIGRLQGDVRALDDAGVQNWTQYGSHGLGVVLNVGAMSILGPVVLREAGEERRRLAARASLRGVGLDIMWSPFFVSTPFTIQLVAHVALWEAMPLGLALAAIGFALSHLFFTRSLDGARFVASIARLRPLLLPALVLVGAVMAVSAGLGLNALQSVAVVVPVLCAGYLAWQGPRAARFVAARTFGNFARLSDELMIVVGAMTLAAVVAALPLVRELGETVTPGVIAGPALMVSLVFALVAAGFAGMHPMIGVGILVPVLASGPFGICPTVLVATAVFAWGLNGLVSPWALPVAAACAQFGVPLRELLTRRSLAFLLAYSGVGLAFLVAVNAMCMS